MAENRRKRPNWRTGAPAGNRNALKTGRYTKERKALRARIRSFRQRVKSTLALVDEQLSQEAKIDKQIGGEGQP